MKTLLAILLGKLILALSRLFKIGGGSAAPGLYALKVDPHLVEKLGRRIPYNIVITGTNGKTTTARLLNHFAKAHGYKVVRNATGSNLERGIASALISHWNILDIFREPKKVLGIWELDEAAFNSIALKLYPEVIIFLNVFRDQLDRYGEIDTVVKCWCETLKKLQKKDKDLDRQEPWVKKVFGVKPSTVVFANGDDANTAKLSSCFDDKIDLFGLKNYKILGEYSYQKNNKKLDFIASDIKIKNLSGISFKFNAYEQEIEVKLPIPGVYNIYNFMAAAAAGTCFEFDLKKSVESLKNFAPAFGRVEKFSLQPGRLHRKSNGYIFLIKNPTGATAVFQTLAPNIKKNDRLLLALNDKLADGTDVSWIWDASFETLLLSSRAKRSDLKIFVSGSRASDLALRLKYAGFDPKQLSIDSNLEQAFLKARAGLKGSLFILPTYTAMLELQSILAKQGLKKNYWEEP